MLVAHSNIQVLATSERQLYIWSIKSGQIAELMQDPQVGHHPQSSMACGAA